MSTSENKDRLTGRFGCIGTAGGKIIGNFWPDGEQGKVYTVYIPANLEQYVTTALVNKFAVNCTFDKLISGSAPEITDILIYN